MPPEPTSTRPDPPPAEAGGTGRRPRRNGDRHAAHIALVFADAPPPPQRFATTGSPAATARRQRPSRPVAPDSHRPHGSYAKYVIEGCGCHDCAKANRDYENRRSQAIRAGDGRWAPYVDAGPARDHLAALAVAGVGLKQVAKVSGLGHGVLSKIVYGDPARRLAPSKRIRPATAAAILAVTAANIAGGARVHGAATWARIDALVAAGYTRTWIAGQLGRSLSNLRPRPQVTAATAAAVAELHRRYLHQAPPPRNTRRQAR